MTGPKSQVPARAAQAPGPEVDERQVEAMRKRVRELAFLHHTGQVLTATLDLDSVLRALLSQVRDYFQAEAASVALLDQETEELVFRVAVGGADEELIGLRLRPDQGVAGWVVQTGQSALVPVAHSDARFYPGVDQRTGFCTRSLLAVPVKIEGCTIGVIEVLNPAVATFDDGGAQPLLLAVAGLAATAIRNAELYERVRQAERRYESLFSESTDPIIVLDLDGKILDLNQRAIEMLGCPREQLSGAELCDVLGMDRDAFHTAIRQVWEGQRLSLEVQVLSDQECWILETYMAKIDYGRQEAIQWVGHDVSERVALERMRDDLTRVIIHDLRNPLSNIIGSLQLIRTAFVKGDETLPVMKLLDIAMRSGQRLHRLIDSLLYLGRLEAGEAELQRGSVSPEALVRQAIDQIQPLALSRGLTLAARVVSGLPHVVADGDLIVRVLTNLLDNAVKFTPRGGRITLSVERREEEILFAVSDTGRGIPSEHRQRVFDRFARVENAAGLKGTGLGLPFCKVAVEAHGGRIWMESEVEHGATFTFTLPFSGEEAG